MSALKEQHFLSYFKKRRDAFRELLRLSEKQHQHVVGDEYSELLVVLAERQQVIDRVLSNRSQHDQVAETWKKARDQLANSQRSQCDEVLAEAEELLSQVMKSDEACTSELQARRDTTQGQLQRITCGSQAHRAYANEEDSTHRFLDIDQ